MILCIMLSKAHSGLGNLVTQLARVPHVHVGFDVPPYTLLVCTALSTIGALKSAVEAAVDHGLQESSKF